MCGGASSAGKVNSVVEAMDGAARAVHEILEGPVVVDSKGVDHALGRILSSQLQNIENMQNTLCFNILKLIFLLFFRLVLHLCLFVVDSVHTNKLVAVHLFSSATGRVPMSTQPLKCSRKGKYIKVI